jgi:hypothetical protein
MTETGAILDFRGSWGSGIASLHIKSDADGKSRAVLCENGPTVRALDACFGNVITGHSVNVNALKGKRISFETDDLGLMVGFVPIEGDDQ